jgi:Copper transport outer membrane protein, MctB
MEQLRVLAGEPLLVIDFRYHLVSLIAVFLAIALGIVIGTTALNQPLLTDIKGQVSSLEQDKRDLENQTRTLKTQVAAGSAFEQAVAPALVNGSLGGRRVLIIETTDQVPSATVDHLTALVGRAGGTVSGTLHLLPAYTDPNKASAIQSYVTGPGLPASFVPPQNADARQMVAALLADALMIPNGQTASSSDTAAISSVLAGLSALQMLAQDSSAVLPSDYAILVTAGAFTGGDADVRNAALVDLASALDAAGSGSVVAGDTGSAGSEGLVGVVRKNTTVSAAVSTIDNVTDTAGEISTILALSRERLGTSGKYGTGKDTQPIPPVPGATQ